MCCSIRVMSNRKNIILVGPMGAGKSAVGRQLAQKLKRQFHDSDHDVVDRTGVDISYIFEKEGEDGFRKRETESILELCAKENILLSTGGGSVIRKENRDAISASGFVIYLHASVNQQVKRTKKKDNRPLLKQDEPSVVLERLMCEREHYYRQVADIVVNTNEQKVSNVVSDIIERLEIANMLNENIEIQSTLVKTKSREYPALTGINLLLEPHKHSSMFAQQTIVVTDENLDILYREKLETLINPLAWLVVPASEESKSVDTYQWLLSELVKLGVKRDAVLIGIGGGVVGDLSGFVAATYMRGMQLMHVPTSLLAMVDSSVGGKTGINLSEGKNLVGSIYQPFTVIADLNFLKTLPEREYLSGLAEVIKYAFLYDENLLEILETNFTQIINRDLDILSQIVSRCVAIKAEIVEADEHDHGLRMLLNLGHTFGHAIETLQEYKGFKHGEAVAIGMCMAADLSAQIGKISQADATRAKNIVKNFGLPTKWTNFRVGDFIKIMQGDKKNTSDTQRFILLEHLGKAYVDENISREQIEALLNTYQ